MTELQEICEAFVELNDDPSTPKNVRTKLENVIVCLNKTSEDVSVRINRALTVLEEVSSDVNIQSFVRMQLLSISSMLESAESSLILNKN